MILTNPIKVFICDDSKPARMMFSRLLTELPYPIEIVGESASGRGTVFMVEDDMPDIVVLKLNIPDDMPSEEVVQALREINPSVYVIFCSLPQHRETLEMMTRAGFVDEFLEKPLRQAALERVISNYVRYKAREGDED
ncbi:MAG: response regulator [Defluviitaleaceae bacterium]|nr:response regulator [Defluviitaleaceae bacterium]